MTMTLWVSWKTQKYTRFPIDDAKMKTDLEMNGTRTKFSASSLLNIQIEIHQIK